MEIQQCQIWDKSGGFLGGDVVAKNEPERDLHSLLNKYILDVSYGRYVLPIHGCIVSRREASVATGTRTFETFCK